MFAFCAQRHSWKGIYSKRKELAPLGICTISHSRILIWEVLEMLNEGIQSEPHLSAADSMTPDYIVSHLRRTAICSTGNTRAVCIFLPSSITKTCLYSFDPLKPHFYIVKLWFTGVNIIFLISAQNIDCGYRLEPPRRGGSNECPQSMFWAEIWKIFEFLSKNFQFFDD